VGPTKVSADRATELVRVEKVWTAHDIGKPQEPMLVVGQIEGSAYVALREIRSARRSFSKASTRRCPVNRPIKASGETSRSTRMAFPSCENVTSSPGCRLTASRNALGMTTCPYRPTL